MPTASSLIDTLTTPRVAGRTLRGVAFAGAGAAFLAVVILCFARGGRFLQSAYWPATVGTTTAIGVVAVALAYDELRRPVRFGLLGRPRDRAIEAAPLRWHPRISGLIDVYDETRALAPMSATTSLLLAAAGAAREASAGRLRVKVAFADPPFRTGGAARIEFRAAWDRGTLEGVVPSVHLRCVREDPSGYGGLATRIETLADLTPQRSEIDGDRENVNLSLSFDLPADLSGADLLAARPVYWVLAVELSPSPEGGFRKQYFVPVTGRASVSP
jgi:hypothetical protein